jgi:hypothetical protein
MFISDYPFLASHLCTFILHYSSSSDSSLQSDHGVTVTVSFWLCSVYLSYFYSTLLDLAVGGQSDDCTTDCVVVCVARSTYQCCIGDWKFETRTEMSAVQVRSFRSQSRLYKLIKDVHLVLRQLLECYNIEQQCVSTETSSAPTHCRFIVRFWFFSLFWAFEISALIDVVYHVTMYILADDAIGCSGVFVSRQNVYFYCLQHKIIYIKNK